jgi:hypothetical protein
MAERLMQHLKIQVLAATRKKAGGTYFHRLNKIKTVSSLPSSFEAILITTKEVHTQKRK